MSDNANQMVPSENPNKAVESWGFSQLMGRYFFSLDRGTPEYKRKLFAMLNMQGVPGQPFVNKQINIVAYLLQPATFNDKKTGEEVTTLMSKLLLDSGEVITTHSGGVAKSLMQAGELLGLPSLQTPYKCTIKELKVGDTDRMWYLDFSDSDGPAKRKDK